MCESDDGQDDRMSRSTGMCESDQAPREQIAASAAIQRRQFDPDFL